MKPRSAAIGAILGFVAINVIVWLLGPFFDRRHQQNLMQPRAAQGEAPRYDWSTGEEPARYWSNIPDARRTKLVILDGMSQQYAINDQAPGEITTAELLDDSLRGSGARVFGVSSPNLNNEEFLLHVQALTLREETRPSLIVYGVCFDKMRNVDLRPGLQRMLVDRAELGSAWRRMADSLATEAPLLAAAMARALADASALKPTRLDQKIEAAVVGGVATALPLVARRSDIRSFLLEELFFFRNWALRIKTSTKRPMLADRYELNREALVAALRLARARHVGVLMYVIPLNPRAETPYVAEEYSAFKQWLEQTAAAEGARFANFESIVPVDDWGLLYGQPDFKHFREGGHIATARALTPLIRSALADAGR